jgi:hypothetical protein
VQVRTSPTAAMGILAGLTALLQLGPVYWPGVGLVLSMAATLPTAVAAALCPARCTWFYVVAAVLTGLFAPEEMFIYVALTGPLGLMLGLFRSKSTWCRVGAGALVLTGGMLLLPGLAGVMPWGGLERGLAPWALVTAYAGFAVVYAAVWREVFDRVWARLATSLPPWYTGEDDRERSCRP